MAQNQLNVRLGLDDKEFAKGLRRSERSLNALAGRFSQIGRGLTTAITVPIALVGGTAIKTSADFEQAMNKVAAISGNISDNTFKRLEETARRMGATTAFSATEAAEGLAFLAQAGFSAEQQIAAIEPTLNLAAAGGISLGEAADIASNVMSGFGATADELTDIIDVMAKQFTSSNTDVLQLGQAFSFVAPTASALGFSIRETSAAIGILSDAGIQSTRAGTGLSAILTILATEADQLGISTRDASGALLPLPDLFEQVEKSGKSSEELLKIFGREAGPKFLALLEQGSEGLRRRIDLLEDVGGTAEEIAAKQIQGLNGSLRLLRSRLEDFFITIGKSGVLRQATSLVQNLAERVGRLAQIFSDLSPQLQQNIIRFALLAAAIGPGLIIIGKLVSVLAASVFVYGRVITNLVSAVAGIKAFIAGTVAQTGAQTAANGVIAQTIVAYRALGLAQKLTIAGLAAAAIAFAVSKFLALRDAIDEVSNANRALAVVNRKGAQQADQEVSKIDKLIKKVEEDNITRKERIGIIRDLQQLYPDYFGNLDAETAKVEDLRAARDRLRTTILATARARAAEGKLTEVSERILELQDEQRDAFAALAALEKQRFQANASGQLRESQGYKNARNNIKRIAAELSSLIDVQDRLGDTIASAPSQAGVDAPVITPPPPPPPPPTPTIDVAGTETAVENLDAVAQATANLSLNFESLTQAAENALTANLGENAFAGLRAGAGQAELELSNLREQFRQFDEVAAAFGQTEGAQNQLDLLKQKIDATRDAIKTAAIEFGASTEPVQVLQEELGTLTEQYTALGAELDLQAEKQTALAAVIDNVTQQVTQGLNQAFGDFFTTLVEGGKDAFGSFTRALGQMVKKIIVDLLKAIATALVLTAILSFLPGGGSASFLSSFAGILGGGGRGFLQGLPGAAQGGIVPDGYKNDTYLARLTSQEAIIPLDRLQAMIDQPNGQMVAETVIRGEDIYLAYTRTNKNRGR